MLLKALSFVNLEHNAIQHNNISLQYICTTPLLSTHAHYITIGHHANKNTITI